MTACFARRLAIVHAESCQAAQAIVAESFSQQPQTIIDLTRDRNQSKWLGQELESTLLFIDSSNTINNLLALFGCVKAPNALYLAFDPNQSLDYFKARILLPSLSAISRQPVSTDNDDTVQHHIEREMAEALTALSHKKGITHLIGERGSGKSTLLGRFIATAILSGKSGIVLSAPIHAASSNSLSVLNKAEIKQNVSRETFDFIPATAILSALNTAKYIIIDEAATYPRETLNHVIQHAKAYNKKLILSTTTEGYEGTGQSYRLSYLRGSADIVQLKIPKRFSEKDPLYQLTQDIYNPDTLIVNKNNKNVDGIHILSQITLREKGWTAACFALLKAAHYKTTPNDLARFYNDAAIFVICIKHNRVISALYALPEVLRGTAAVKDIFVGKRRVKNALTQQALINAYGDIEIVQNGRRKSASTLKILRISRIATETSERRKNIATNLINQLKKYAKNAGYDAISTSFSGAKKNLLFWQAQQFTPVRLGLYPNKINAEYAVLMMKVVTETSDDIIHHYHGCYKRHLNYFQQSYPSYFAALQIIGKNTDNHRGELCCYDEIASVIDGHRDINWALPRLAQEKVIAQVPGTAMLFNGTIRNKTTQQQDHAMLAALMTQVKLLK